jgi:multidrug efflux pump subunit AcrB
MEVAREIESVPEAAKIEVIGGQRRQVRILPDPARLAGRGLSILDIAPAVQAASAQRPAGTLTSANREILVEAGPYLSDNDNGPRVMRFKLTEPVVQLGQRHED